MIVRQVDILHALHSWCTERILDPYTGRTTASEKTRDALYWIETVLGLLTFPALNYLYVATRRIPSPWTTDGPAAITSQATEGLYIKFNLTTEHYLLLRTILSLVGDVFLCSRSLLEKERRNLTELYLPIKSLKQSAEPFYDARCFFTHLDEVISNPGKHGISGATPTKCGIEYGIETKGCRHWIIVGDEVHFSYRNEAKAINISKSAFNGIFESARLVYSEVTSHKLHAQAYHYPPADQIYPL